MSVFSHIPSCPSDPIFGVAQVYNESTHPSKALLTVGVYRDEDGLPYTFPSVYKAEERLLHRFSHEYIPMAGYPPFVREARRFLWTDAILAEIGERTATVQTCAGTGALFLVSRLGKIFMDFPTVLICNPFWSSYTPIFQENHHTITYYPYIKDWAFDCEGTLAVMDAAPEGSLVVLQVSGHNPTGLDPSEAEWEQVFACALRKRHLICFDFAYIGFGSGDMDADAWPVRRYARLGAEFFVAFSFSKCMGLYGERVGALHVVCKEKSCADALAGQLVRIARGTWSVCPQNGSYIVAEVLSSPDLLAEWREEVRLAAKRVIDTRNRLCDLLKEKTGKEWVQIRRTRGFFAFTGFDPEQVKKLSDEYGVFLIGNGRITIPTVNAKNIEHVAAAIAEVSKLRD
jgi:aspartate/tyrosine/aromatic aminotransferase